jgi:hypothetical protein
MADLPMIPQRRPQPNVYTVLLVASALLLLAGSVIVALNNQEVTEKGPFEYLAK